MDSHDDPLHPTKTTSPTENKIHLPEIVDDVGGSFKKAGNYLRYILKLAERQMTITELHSSLGIAKSNVSRDIASLKKARPALIEPSLDEVPKGLRGILLHLTPLGREIAELANKTIRASQQRRDAGSVDEKTMAFYLSKVRSSIPQTRSAAFEGLLEEARKEKLWQSEKIWQLIGKALANQDPASLYYGTELLHRIVMSAFTMPGDTGAKRVALLKLRTLLNTQKGGSDAFWRATVDDGMPLHAHSSKILGIMKIIYTEREFFQKCWQLWLWRATRKEESPKDFSADDGDFWISVDPVMIELDAASREL